MVQIPSSFALLYSLSALAGVRAACIGPPVNQATLSLVEEFEGFRADVCKSLPRFSQTKDCSNH
jgi:hypothetical protein